MDAEQKISHKGCLLFAAAAFFAAPAFAQTLQVNTTDITLPTGGQTFANISVTSSNAGAIPFTVGNVVGSFYSVSVINSVGTAVGSSGTTPQTVQVTLLTSSPFAQNGSFTVTDTGNAANKVTVAVHYVPGGSGGGTNLISANPNPLNLSVVSGGSTSGFITLSTTSVGAVAYSIGTPTGGFITGATANLFTISAGNPATLTVTASAGILADGVYQGTIPITPNGGTNLIINVSLTVGSGSGSTTYQFTNGTTTFNFAYPSGTQTAQTIVTSTNGAVTSFNASTNVNWLAVNGTSQLTGVAVNSVLSLSLNSVAATLTTGSYTGIVTVSNPTNPFDFSQLFVNLAVNQGTLPNLTATPPSLTFNVAVGSGLTSSQISLSAPTATTVSGFTYSTSNGSGWLTATLNSSTLPAIITATVNPGGLIAGTYNGSISATFANGVNGTQTFPVTMIVGGGSGGTGNVVAPTSLTFYYQQGSGAFVPQQSVTVSGTGNFSLGTITQSGSTQWISATGTAVAPGLVVVGVIPAALTPGTYTATVPVVTASGTTNLAVTLVVSAGVVLYGNPASFNVSSSSSTQLTVSASDNSSIPFTASSSASWVTLGTPSSTTTPSAVLVTVNTTGLPNGINTASVTITGTGASNSSFTIPVVANVTGSSAGTLTLSQSSLTFNAVSSGSAPASQTLNVSAATTTNFTVSTSVQSGGTNWLTVSPSGSLNTNQALTVSVNQAGLAAGTYNATISLSVGGAVQNVPVTLTVTGGTITVSPTSLVFSSGGNLTQSLTVASSVTGVNVITYTVAPTTTSGGNWLSTSVTSGFTPSQFNVVVNTTGLATGTYHGNVAVTPSSGPTVNVAVTLNVTTLTVTATTANGTSLAFAYRVGDATPQGQTITVGGGTGASFTATASSNGTWLGVSSTTGVTPAAIQATVNPAGLNPGTYNGTVVVAGTGGATGSTTISVVLTVTAPLPTINTGGVTNAASYLTGAISPGEIITIFGTAIGPTTAVGLTLDASGMVSTSIGGVQVLINNFAAPLILVSEKQVSAVVPYELAPFLTATVQVKYLGQTSNGINVSVAATAPGVFTSNQTGSGGVAALDASQVPAGLNTPGNPAAIGDTLTMYMTGEGITSPAVTGRVTPGTLPYTLPLLAPTVLVDGIPAHVDFYGEAPFLTSGVLQINFVIPVGARSGDRSLVVRMGGVDSQPGATVSIK